MNDDATQSSYRVMRALITRWLGGAALSDAKVGSYCLSRNGRAFGLFRNSRFSIEARLAPQLSGIV